MRLFSARALFLLAGVALIGTGCASGTDEPYVPKTAEGYEARTASALVYSPRMLNPGEAAELEMALSREGRGSFALLGYDLPTVSYYTLRVDDRQRTLDFGWGGRGVQLDDYDRRATSVRSFVRYR